MSVLDLVTVQKVMNKIWQLGTGAAAGGDELIRSVQPRTLSHITVRALSMTPPNLFVCLFVYVQTLK